MPSYLGVVAAFAVISSARGAFCSGKPDPNAQPNLYEVNTTAPTFVRSVPNGKLYRAGTPGFDFNVAHLYGSAYELGAAQGSLFHDIAANLTLQVWAYFESQITSDLSSLPAWLADIIANLGLEVALDIVTDLTAPSTPQHFLDELRGFADASGADYKMILRIHMIGELTQGDCSMFGAWGAMTTDGKMLSMRALDWDTGALKQGQRARPACDLSMRSCCICRYSRGPVPYGICVPPHRGPRFC